MEEAARTSVLSHRWENLWKYFGGSFDFRSSVTDHLKPSQEERTRYINWVTEVLFKHQGTAMDKLRLQFRMDRMSEPVINDWIAYALEKRVKSLELHLFRPPLFGFRLTSSLVSGFGCLQELYLRNLKVTDEVFANIPCYCPLLETLCLENITPLTEVKVVCPSIKLKHLNIHVCTRLVNVEISAPHLVSFTYYGPKIRANFKSSPRLSNLSLTGCCGEFLLSQLQQPSMICFSRLENLVMDLDGTATPRAKLFLTELSNLKNLELVIWRYCHPSISFLTSLIEAAPFLEKFTLQIKYQSAESTKSRWMANESIEWRNASNSSIMATNRYLKVVEIIGFDGHCTDLQFANFLLRKTVSLEKLIINTKLDHHKWPPKMDGIPFARERAKLLETKLPPGAKLEIL